MTSPTRYPKELRDRATRLAIEARKDPATASSAYRRIGEQLGVHPETLRTWVKRVESHNAQDSAITTVSDIERIRELERDNRELRRANEILKSASAFFAAELDRPYR